MRRDLAAIARVKDQQQLSSIIADKMCNQIPGITHTKTLLSLSANYLPVYNGSGPLRFTFTKSFAQKYLDGLVSLAPDGILTQRDWDDDKMDARYKEYVNLLPGIHMATDKPSGNGGRINLLSLSCLEVGSDNNFYVNNNLGILRYTNDECAGKDTTLAIVFVPGDRKSVV